MCVCACECIDIGRLTVTDAFQNAMKLFQGSLSVFIQIVVRSVCTYIDMQCL